ncbi:RNA methyltransferase [Sandaracinobacter sp. RS1-74]|uniref:RNA methyltransferase n=1 Tax=Sandaracinobacteroides sayramensis TaxID=2913411 RepID=UPI001EDB3B6C|nr:RNA methyltransferase [Sandaracinobacteroides sayramensis]MCG2841898.1 RNA methyltransferase [Sandaracinobacteroides sayramensis]
MDIEAPAIILVRPQLGMNIGMAARAMGNFALDRLRLVEPRDGWPNPEAGPPASGADHVLETVTVHGSVAGALADCQLTFATTVRPRDMAKPVVTPKQAAALIREAAAQGLKAGILFGPERSGLTADDLAPVQTIITCPVNPGFGSLNLAQAVLLVGYEWFQSSDPEAAPARTHQPAPHGEVAGLIAHLEAELEEAGYFHVPDRTPATRRTLAQMLSRPQFSAEEVRTLRGVIRALAEGPKRKARGAP